MAALDYSDRFTTTLANSYTSGGVSLVLSSTSGLGISGACNFYLIVEAEGGNSEEVFAVSDVSGSTLTVVGAQANTTASNHGAGAVVIASVMTKDAYTQLKTDASYFTLIQTITTAGSQTNVDFTSIPGSYTHLRIMFQARAQASNQNQGMRIKMNNDGTGANYSTGLNFAVITSGSVPASSGGGDSNGLFAANVTGASATASFPSIGEIFIPAYAIATFFKRFFCTSGYDQSGQDDALLFSNGTWKSTSAITRVTLTLNSSDTFVNGSTFSLYGMK